MEYLSKKRIERIALEENLTVFSPLWHINQETEFRLIVSSNFELIFTQISAYRLDRSRLGRKITLEDIERLRTFRGLNIAREGIDGKADLALLLYMK